MSRLQGQHGVKFLTFGQWLVLATLLLVATQIALVFIRGEAYCPTIGCKIVEDASPLSSTWLNLAGFFYLAVLAFLYVFARKGSALAREGVKLLLLAGMAAEGALAAFQYRLGSFCLYCGVVLSSIVVLNILQGGRQLVRAILVFLTVFFAAVLLLIPQPLRMEKEAFTAGTVAERAGTNSGEDRYLFFSASCPHCKVVLAALEKDKSAGLKLNPIEPADELIPGDFHKLNNNPTVNKGVLAAMGIDTVPVLFVKRHNEMSILLGEKEIMSYLTPKVVTKEVKQESMLQSEQSSMPAETLIPPSEGDACSVETDCTEAP